MTARKYPNSNTKWTVAEFDFLRANYHMLGGKGSAVELGRTPAACCHKAHMLGLAVKRIGWLRPPRRLYLAALNVAADAAGVHVDHLIGRSRRRKFVRARWHAWKILYDTGKYSTPGIGLVAGYDHSTCVHGLRKLRQCLSTAQ